MFCLFCWGFIVVDISFRVTFYVSMNWVSLGSNNGLSLNRYQSITWCDADVLSFRPMGTNFSQINMNHNKIPLYLISTAENVTVRLSRFVQASICYSIHAGPWRNIKTVFPGMGISMLKIRRSRDRLIFNMGISILVRRHLYIELCIESHGVGHA